MRWLVIGGTGMLGTDLVSELSSRGHEPVAPTRAEFDITDPLSSGKILSGEFGPLDICVNCAAYTAVDRAETEVREATELNAIGPAYLASACAVANLRFIHISTDFVFDGATGEPYAEDAPTNPIGTYGRTKRQGELEVLQSHPLAVVVRTAWLYGPNGNSFPKTMIRAWNAGKNLRVVADQTGCPTYTADLARVLVDLAERNPFPGIYHAVGPEAMTWYRFALRAISAYAPESASNVHIEPIRTEDWPTPAARPAYSVLSTNRLRGLGIAPMRPVDAALADFVSRIGPIPSPLAGES